MNLGILIFKALESAESNIDFLPTILSTEIPLYFQRLFMQYSPAAVEGFEPGVKPGGFMYAGEVAGPTYTYPMLGNDYAIAVAVTPPVSLIDAILACRNPSGFWVPIFELIGKYIIRCKITFCNVASGLSVPFVIGWDQATKEMQVPNQGILESIERTLPATWKSIGESFNASIMSMQLCNTEEIWKMFGDYVDLGITTTMNWVFNVNTLKNPSEKNPGLPGSFSGTLTAMFTKLP